MFLHVQEDLVGVEVEPVLEQGVVVVDGEGKTLHQEQCPDGGHKGASVDGDLFSKNDGSASWEPVVDIPIPSLINNQH